MVVINTDHGMMLINNKAPIIKVHGLSHQFIVTLGMVYYRGDEIY